MKKKLRQLWDFFSGKKRNIGIGIMLLEIVAKAFLPALLTPDQYTAIGAVGAVIAGGGLFHSVTKLDKVQNVLKKVKINSRKANKNK